MSPTAIAGTSKDPAYLMVMYDHCSSAVLRTFSRNSFGNDCGSTRFDVVVKSFSTGFTRGPLSNTSSRPLARAPTVVAELTISLMSASISFGEPLLARINL